MRNLSAENRTKLENTIIRAALKDIFAAGYSVSVETYGEFEIEKSRQPSKVIAALRATDYDNIRIYDGDKYLGRIFLVWGNEPYEVISDYSTAIEHLLKNAIQKAEDIETRLMY